MSSDIWRIARPHKPVRAHVRMIGGLAVIETEEGALAVVPPDEVCRLAERYNLVIEGFNCGKQEARALGASNRSTDKPARGSRA